MKKDDLEKHFRDGLKNLETGPPDEAKASIEKRLLENGMLKESEEKRGALWMPLLLLLVVITPFVIMLSKSGSDKRVVKQFAKATEQPVATQSDAAALTINEKQNHEGSESTSVNAETKESSNAGKTSEVNDKTITKVEIQEADKPRIKKKKNVEQVSAAVPIDNSEKAKSRGANRIRKSKKNPEEKMFASVNTAQSEADEKNNKEENSLLENSGSNQVAMAGETPSVMLNSPSGESSEQKEERQAEEEKPLEKEPPDEMKEKATPAETAKEKLQIPKIIVKPVVAVDFSGAPQFSNITYGNVAYNYKTISEESRQSEKELPSFVAAFGLVISFNNFITETGMRHSILASDFSYHQDSTHYLATNKISFIEVPFLTGYRWHIEKFEMEFKLGAMMSFITDANTTTFSLRTGEVVTYDELEDSPYRKTHWSALGAVNMLYPLSDRFSAFIQPSMKHGLNSMFKENYSISKKVQSVAVAVGLRVRL
jgi:hypothetical protein